MGNDTDSVSISHFFFTKMSDSESDQYNFSEDYEELNPGKCSPQEKELIREALRQYTREHKAWMENVLSTSNIYLPPVCFDDIYQRVTDDYEASRRNMSHYTAKPKKQTLGDVAVKSTQNFTKTAQKLLPTELEKSKPKCFLQKLQSTKLFYPETGRSFAEVLRSKPTNISELQRAVPVKPFVPGPTVESAVSKVLELGPIIPLTTLVICSVGEKETGEDAEEQEEKSPSEDESGLSFGNERELEEARKREENRSRKDRKRPIRGHDPNEEGSESEDGLGIPIPVNNRQINWKSAKKLANPNNYNGRAPNQGPRPLNNKARRLAAWNEKKRREQEERQAASKTNEPLVQKLQPAQNLDQDLENMDMEQMEFYKKKISDRMEAFERAERERLRLEAYTDSQRIRDEIAKLNERLLESEARVARTLPNRQDYQSDLLPARPPGVPVNTPRSQWPSTSGARRHENSDYSPRREFHDRDRWETVDRDRRRAGSGDRNYPPREDRHFPRTNSQYKDRQNPGNDTRRYQESNRPNKTQNQKGVPLTRPTLDPKATDEQRELVRQAQNSGSSEDFVDGLIMCINDIIAANNLCNEESYEIGNRGDCWTAHGGPELVLSGLKHHSKFLLDRAARKANKLISLECLTLSQAEELESLLDVSSALESLLDTRVDEATPESVAVFSATLTELANTAVPSFRFIRKPNNYKIPNDMPGLLDSDGDEPEPEHDNQGPVAEACESPTTRREEVELSSSLHNKEKTQRKLGIWQTRNARRKRATNPEPTRNTPSAAQKTHTEVSQNSEKSWRTWLRTRWNSVNPTVVPGAPSVSTRKTWTLPDKLRSAFARKPQEPRRNLQKFCLLQSKNWTKFFRGKTNATPPGPAGPVMESGGSNTERNDTQEGVPEITPVIETPSDISINSDIPSFRPHQPTTPESEVPSGFFQATVGMQGGSQENSGSQQYQSYPFAGAMGSTAAINALTNSSQNLLFVTPQQRGGTAVYQPFSGSLVPDTLSANEQNLSTPPRMSRSNSLPRLGGPAVAHTPQEPGPSGRSQSVSPQLVRSDPLNTPQEPGPSGRSQTVLPQTVGIDTLNTTQEPGQNTGNQTVLPTTSIATPLGSGGTNQGLHHATTANLWTEQQPQSRQQVYQPPQSPMVQGIQQGLNNNQAPWQLQHVTSQHSPYQHNPINNSMGNYYFPTPSPGFIHLQPPQNSFQQAFLQQQSAYMELQRQHLQQQQMQQMAFQYPGNFNVQQSPWGTFPSQQFPWGGQFNAGGQTNTPMLQLPHHNQPNTPRPIGQTEGVQTNVAPQAVPQPVHPNMPLQTPVNLPFQEANLSQLPPPPVDHTQQLMAQIAAMQQSINLLTNPQAVAAKPKIYSRIYTPWATTDKDAIGVFEKRLLLANSAVMFNPNVLKDTIIDGTLCTASVTRYIKEMEKECRQIPDTRAANALAMRVHGSISLIVKNYCGTYNPLLANGLPNPQDNWSYVCEFLDKTYKIDDGIKDLRKQLMELRPAKETATNNALQVFRSQFLSLKAQIVMLTPEGEKSRDPYRDAEEERDHILSVISVKIRHKYLEKHNMDVDKSTDTSQFWREILQFQRTYAETLDPVRQVTYSRMEARPRDETQSYVNVEDVICFNCKEKGHYSPNCPKPRQATSADRNDNQRRSSSRDRARNNDIIDTPRRERSQEREKSDENRNAEHPRRGRSRDRQGSNHGTDAQHRSRSRSRDRRDSRGRTPAREDTERNTRLNAMTTEPAPIISTAPSATA